MFKFLEKLQNLDEATKRRWMFILSGIAMVVVVFVWLAYFNNLVSGFGESEIAIAESVEAESFPFFETAGSALAATYRAFWGLLRGFGEVLNEPREYIINPPQ